MVARVIAPTTSLLPTDEPVVNGGWMVKPPIRRVSPRRHRDVLVRSGPHTLALHTHLRGDQPSHDRVRAAMAW